MNVQLLKLRTWCLPSPYFQPLLYFVFNYYQLFLLDANKNKLLLTTTTNYLNDCRIQTCTMLRSLQDFASTHVTQQTTTQSCFASNCATLTLRINTHGFFTLLLSRLPLKSVIRKASGTALLKAILKFSTENLFFGFHSKFETFFLISVKY